MLEKLEINDGLQPDKHITTAALNSFEHALDIQLKGLVRQNTKLQTEVKTDLQSLVSNDLKPFLEKKTGCSRLSDRHSIFSLASRFMFKHHLSLNARLQFPRLLQGSLDLPVILMQIPKEGDYKRSSEEDCPLQWLQDCLQCHDLDLHDVIVLDLLPMITEEWFDKSDEKAREEAIKEVYNFVVYVLEKIKPSIIVSCQCLAGTCWNQRDLWGVLTESVVIDPCSSISRAEKQ